MKLSLSCSVLLCVFSLVLPGLYSPATRTLPGLLGPTWTWIYLDLDLPGLLGPTWTTWTYPDLDLDLPGLGSTWTWTYLDLPGLLGPTWTWIYLDLDLPGLLGPTWTTWTYPDLDLDLPGLGPTWTTWTYLDLPGLLGSTMEYGRQVHSSGIRQYKCAKCRAFASFRYMSVFHHIKMIHSFESNFSVICGIEECQATFKNMQTWRKHIRKEHQRARIDANDASVTPGSVSLHVQHPLTFDEHVDLPDDYEEPTQQILPTTDMKRNAALFIMNTRDSGCVTQRFLDSLLGNLSTLHEQMAHGIHQRVLRDMEGASESLKSAVSAAVLDERNYDIFRDLRTEYHQNAYFRSSFDMIEPSERVLGRVPVHTSSGFKLQNECCYDVPLLQTLQSMLNCQVVKENVLNSHAMSGNVLGDYCDGTQFAAHRIFKDNPSALQVILYYDDVEVANPLGSSATVHKLGLFYFSLGNLKPRLRSTTDSIQLVAVVKCDFLNKYGVDEILKPFVEDIKKLESDEGIFFDFDGEQRRFHGGLVAFCGDNLASQLVGGFKALNSALRRCRHCMATKESLQEKFLSSDFSARTVVTHKTHCDLLGGPTHQHIATTYGVTRDSILNSLQDFHVVTGLPPDLMHDVLEGSIQVELCCLLRDLITVKKLFSLALLNERIRVFPWGADAKDHPPRPLSDKFLSEPMATNLKLGASEAWSLARLLPILVGDLVPEDDINWANYVLLLEIVGVVMAPKMTRGEASSLAYRIKQHHAIFKEIYPNRPLTPKMHYMVHIPEWTIRVGPLRNMWCMRYEAKHHYFKKMARVIGNFKNIAKSVAFRHQRYMCYLMSSPAAYLQDKVEMGRVESVDMERFEYKEELLSVTNVSVGSTLRRTKWIVYRGVKYAVGDIVVVRLSSEDLDPVFGVILCVVLHLDIEPQLVVDNLKTIGFDDHFCAYEAKPLAVKCVTVMSPGELADHNIVGSYQPFNSTSNFLYPKYRVLDDNNYRF